MMRVMVVMIVMIVMKGLIKLIRVMDKKIMMIYDYSYFGCK
jgi:hypothetical protein